MATNSPVPTMGSPGDYFLNLVNTAKAIGGSAGSRTTSTNVSAEGINRIIQSALQGQSGLAGILSAPAIAGGYNSSARSLLANDLLARISAEAAAKTSSVTERTTTGGVNTSDIFKSLAIKEGSNMAASALKKAIASASSGSAMKVMTGFYNPNASLSSAPLENTLSDWMATSGSGSTDLGISGSVTGYDGISAAAGSTSASFLDSFNPYAGVATAAFNLADGEWGGNDLGATIGATAGSYFGPIGSAVGGWLGGAVGDSALNGTESYLANSGGGLLTGDADLGDVINSGGGTRDILQTDYNVVKDGLNAVGGALSTVGGWFDDGCFITTAVMLARDGELFEDNCEELTVLRKFRDEYMRKYFPELIEKYYAEAPAIVAKINATLGSAHYWNHLYIRYIKPAVEFAKLGDNYGALAVYTDLFDEVKDQSEVE